MKHGKRLVAVMLAVFLIVALMPSEALAAAILKVDRTHVDCTSIRTQTINVTYTGSKTIYYDIVKGDSLVDAWWDEDWNGDRTKLYIRPEVSNGGTATVLVYEYGHRANAKKITVNVSNCTLNAYYQDGSIYIEWTSSIFDKSYDEYEVWRSTSLNGNFTKIDTPYTWWSEDNNYIRGNTYYYKIRGINYNGETSEFSHVVSCTVPLAKPTLSLRVVGTNSIKLSWNKVNGATGYKIYRSTSANGYYSLVKTITSGSATSWTNTGLKQGQAKYYKIRACKNGVCGPLSNRKYAVPRRNAYINHPSIRFDEYGGVNLRDKEVYYYNGNIVYKALALNDRIFRANKFNWIRITIYSDDKILASQKFYNKYIGLDPYDYKTMTFIFNKGTRIRYENLRYSDIYVDYQYNYSYSY